jgi:hypothetical protein
MRYRRELIKRHCRLIDDLLGEHAAEQNHDYEDHNELDGLRQGLSWIWVSAWINPTRTPTSTAAISAGLDTISTVSSAAFTLAKRNSVFIDSSSVRGMRHQP